jgi:hypothetical protein
MPLSNTKLLQKKGTGNKKQKLLTLELQSKKTVSLFQSHVFKHEFFLFPVARSLFPLNKS